MSAVKIWSLLMTCIVSLKAECVWNGKPYPIGPITSDDPCQICHCLANDSYACSISNCPIPKDNCTAKKIPGHCCPVYNCGQNGSCRYKEKSVNAGEHFDLDVITMDCICLPNGDPDCTKCSISPEKLNSDCKPVYAANKMCPVDFICGDNGNNFKKSIQNLDFNLTNRDNSSGNDENISSQNLSVAPTSLILPLSINKLNSTSDKIDTEAPFLEADYKSNNGFKPDSWKPALPKNDEWAMPIGAKIPISKGSDIMNETSINPLDTNETSWAGINASKPIRYPIIEADIEPDDTENILNINKPGQNNDSFFLSSPNLKSMTPVPHSFRDWDSNSDPNGFHLNLPAINIENPLLSKEKNMLPKEPPHSPTINIEYAPTISPALIPSHTNIPLNNFPMADVLHGENDFTTQSAYSPNSGSQISTVLPLDSMLTPSLVDFKADSSARDNLNVNEGVKKESESETYKKVDGSLISETWLDNQTDDIANQLKLNVTSLHQIHMSNYSKVENNTVTTPNMTHEKESLVSNIKVNSSEGILAFDNFGPYHNNYSTTISSIEVISSVIPNLTFYQENRPLMNNITNNKKDDHF